MIKITPAQRTAERRAIILGCFFLLIGSSTLIMPLLGLSGWELSISSFAAPFVYGTTIWFYGWPRLRTGLAALSACGGAGIDEMQTSNLEKIFVGLLIEGSFDKDQSQKALITISTNEDGPYLSMILPGEKHVDPETSIAILDTIVGNQNPYLFMFFHHVLKTAPLSEISSHAHLTGMKALADARSRSAQMRIHTRRASTAARGGYLDRLVSL
jgi:hypothetical protein